MPKSHLDQVSRELVEKGLLIEAGWIGLRMATLPADTPPAQLTEMRNAFFAGAQHLFASLMTILDPGDVEPTAADLDRMSAINAELKTFIEDFAARHLPTRGSA